MLFLVRLRQLSIIDFETYRDGLLCSILNPEVPAFLALYVDLPEVYRVAGHLDTRQFLWRQLGTDFSLVVEVGRHFVEEAFRRFE